MLSYIFLTLLIYVIYRFVAGFLIPVFIATRRMRHQMRNMNGNGTGGFSGNDSNDTNIKHPTSDRDNNKQGRPNSKDYIEFEEIK